MTVVLLKKKKKENKNASKVAASYPIKENTTKVQLTVANDFGDVPFAKV